MATILQADQTLPPGTQRIETSTGTEIVLSPIPSPDPNQPLNWPKWRKALHMTLLCLYCVLVFATLTVATPLWVNINAETGISFDALNDAYAAGSAALAVGCLFFVPMGLKFGRRPVYIATSLLMTASAIWQGRSQNTANFIVSNTIAGFAGAANEALFQVTVSDLFFVHQRASINGIYLAAVCLGNYLGPVAAGYVAVAQDWRWVFYYLTIFLAVTSIALIFLLEESKFPSPVFNGHSTGIAKANTQPHDSNNSGEKVDFKSAAHGPDSRLSIQATRESVLDRSSIPIHSYWKRHRLYTLDPESSRNKQNSFLRHVFQPFELLCRFPAVAFVALQYGWLISMLSIVAVTQATLLPAPPYNFSAAAVGLMSLPPAIGAFLGSMVGGPLVDVLAVQVAKRRAGIHEPETRLWFYMVPGCGLIIGALLYGLSIAKGEAWIINAIGAGFVGFALGGCGDMSLTYLQDSYQYILGDALVGVVFIRNALSTALIFAVPAWQNNMGTYNMFIVVGVICAVVVLTSIPFVVWGRRWRVKLAGLYFGFAERQY